MKLLLKSTLGLAFAIGLVAQAQAFPVETSPMTPNDAIVKVYGGCGPYGHRGPWGGCRHGGQWGGYGYGRACPPGWHLGAYGRRCWRNW